LMNTPQTRASILEKTIEKFKAAGVPVDADPILHGWLAAWVEGGLKMSDIAQRYQDLLKARLAAKTGSAAMERDADQADLAATHKHMDQHQLLEEVARLLAETS
jgi:hypothetical protein